MQQEIWPFMIVGLAMPMISGCGGTIVSCTRFFGPPSQFQPVDFQDAAATTVTGINNSGEIVGYSTNSNGVTRAFRGRPGSLTTIDPPPLPDGSTAFSSEADAINNRGDVVVIGHYRAGARTYLFNGTSFTALSNTATGQPLLRPGGINDDPQVVGPRPTAVRIIEFPQGYVYDVNSSTFHDVTVFSNMSTYLAGINNTHRMVGSLQSGGPFITKAFYLESSDVTNAQLIDISGATSSVGSGINNAADPGCIKHVGTYWTADGNSHGFVHLQAGQLATFDVPNAVQTAAYGVNDNGDIVGSFQDKAGKTHGFLAPAPF
jgi:probable HAF family extracellular repeat protein